MSMLISQLCKLEHSPGKQIANYVFTSTKICRVMVVLMEPNLFRNDLLENN